MFDVTWYARAAGVPEYTPVHAGDITGVLTPLHGVKVTTPVEVSNEYEPTPATTTEVAVHVGTLCPEPHSRTVFVVNV